MEMGIKSILKFAITGIENGKVESVKDLLQDVVDQMPDDARVVGPESENKDPYAEGGD